MEKYVVTDTESLRKLCVENGWFTAGSAAQYEKMFDCNRIEGYSSITMKDIALIIWLCSDGFHVNDIFSKLYDARKEYKMRIGGVNQ